MWEEDVRIKGEGTRIKVLDETCCVTCFLVSEREGNLSRIDGLPVLTLDEFCRGEEMVLIAAPENHHRAMAARLEERGIRDYLCIDSRWGAALMERYYQTTGGFLTLHSYEASADGGDVDGGLKVCMIRFHRDTPLKNSYELPRWIRPIQAGRDQGGVSGSVSLPSDPGFLRGGLRTCEGQRDRCGPPLPYHPRTLYR